MPPIEVTQVNSPKEQGEFIRFPWRIYANDPAWVPPLIIERKEFLSRKHPFFAHGDAALFLARSGAKIVGRIMASDDPNYNAIHDTNTGCFGMFDSIDDQEVANALFDAAEGWVRGKGRTEIMGPIDYSTNYLCGLLIHGFEHPPTLLTSHNPPYYAALIERWGFEKTMDLYAWWFSDPKEAAARLRRLMSRMKNRQPAVLRQADTKNLDAEGQRIRAIYNQAWSKNWGFVPFSEAEMAYMTKELKPIVEPELTLLAEVDGEPLGFILAVRDINVALQKINGRLTWFGLPIGLAKLLYYKNRIKRYRLIALGVVEKYRRHGIAEALVLRVIEEAMIKRGITGEQSLTLENNFMINRFLEAIGAQKYKTYRIYRRRLTEDERA
ncbi:MAG: GNAT family N-acetyltransferase [Chthoniobacterales bacterium]